MNTTTIYITDENKQLKKEIEKSLDGAKLTHSAIYSHGLIALKNLADQRIKISLEK